MPFIRPEQDNEAFLARCKASEGKHVCIDCSLHGTSTLEELEAILEGGYCKHFTPEWWKAQGWKRNWGDAAVMGWPLLEILRKADMEKGYCEFLILCPQLRRPITIRCKDPYAWGGY